MSSQQQRWWTAGDRVRLGVRFLHYPVHTQALCWETYERGRIRIGLFVFADGGAHSFTPRDATEFQMVDAGAVRDRDAFYRTTGFAYWWGDAPASMLEIIVAESFDRLLLRLIRAEMPGRRN